MFNFKIVFVILLISSYQVNAVPIVLTGNVAGEFWDESTYIEWGRGSNRGESHLFSSLNFVSVGDFSTESSQPFKMATLTYSNAVILASTSYQETVVKAGNNSLDIQLGFTSPGVINGLVFNYDLLIVETDNNLSDSADKVLMVPADEFNPLFFIDNQAFYFEFMGFSQGEGVYDNFFTQEEATSSTIDLYARITAVPVPSAVWLFVTALSGVFIKGRQRNV